MSDMKLHGFMPVKVFSDIGGKDALKALAKNAGFDISELDVSLARPRFPEDARPFHAITLTVSGAPPSTDGKWTFDLGLGGPYFQAQKWSEIPPGDKKIPSAKAPDSYSAVAGRPDLVNQVCMNVRMLSGIRTTNGRQGAQIKDLFAQIKDLFARLKDLTASKDEQLAEMKAAIATVAKQDEQLAEMKAAIAATNAKQLAEMKAEIAATNAEQLAEMKAAIAATNAKQLAEMKAAIAELKAGHASQAELAVAKVEAENATLRTELAAAKAAASSVHWAAAEHSVPAQAWGWPPVQAQWSTGPYGDGQTPQL